MASSQLSQWNGTSERAPDELLIVLNSKLAEECEEHQALTKKLMDDGRMAVQSQLDDMRRTFQAMFEEHSKTTECLMEEQRKASEQRLQGVLQTCQQVEGRVEQIIAEERAAVQGALQSVARALRCERAQRQSELQRVVGSFGGGLLGDEPPSNKSRVGGELDIRPDAGPPSSKARDGEELDARIDADPGQWSATLEARVAQLEHLARTAGRPAELEQHPTATAHPPRAGAADGGLEAAPLEGAGDDLELVVAEGAVAVPAAEGEVALGESMWDAAALIGCSEAGACASLFTALALLMNILVQVVFIAIVNDSLTPAGFNEETVQEYESWRTMIAHNVKFVDDLTYESLARKVCEFRDAPMSSGPIEGFTSISQYLGVRGKEKGKLDAPPLNQWLPEETEVGPWMCRMALFVWFCTVWKEICSVVNVAHAFSLLPSGKTTISKSSNGLALTSVSSLRRGMFYGIIFVRSLVCMTLATCGAFYLAATISLSDLLLNAVALEVVLSLDELAFEVFAPSSIRALVSLLDPLPRPPSPAWHGLDAKPLVALLAIVAGTFGVWGFILVPQVELLGRARSALCDGDLDFIFTCDQAGIVVAYSPTVVDESAEMPDATSLYNYRAVREMILDGVDPDSDILESGAMSEFALGYTGNRFSVRGRADADISSATHHLNSYCTDMDWNGSVSWPVLSDALETAGVFNGLVGPFTSCLDVAPFCAWEASVSTRARQYCPVTCGCDDPASKLILVGPEQGCPLTCASTPSYVQALGDMNCTDWAPESPTTLYGVDLMDAYLAGLYKMSWMMSWPEAEINNMVFMMNVSMMSGGCPGLASFMAKANTGWNFGNLCKWDNPYGFKPITTFCPVSCGCEESNDILCPTAC